MKYEVLTALMETISSYEPLKAYALQNFGKDFTHVVGNALKSKPARSNFPFISYVPFSEDISAGTNRTYRSNVKVYLLYGIHEENVSLATKKVLEISEILKECLRENYTLNGKASLAFPTRFETDEGYFQPFYYARMLVEIWEV